MTRDDETEDGSNGGDGGRSEPAGGPGGNGESARTDGSVPGVESDADATSFEFGAGSRSRADVDLDVGRGEYVTVVGPNGAGKSTVMKSVFGLTTYMDGTVEFADAAIHGLPPEAIIHEGIGYVPQTDNVFESLSVRENLEMGAYVLDEVPEDRIETIYDRFPILRERSDQRAGTMSGGQRQMLAMGRALMLDPDLLLLDEPSAGLAPDLVAEMFDRIDRINDDGTAVLMVEQNAKEALRRCDRGYVLVNGENAYVDTGDALLADEQVRKDFLGG